MKSLNTINNLNKTVTNFLKAKNLKETFQGYNLTKIAYFALLLLNELEVIENPKKYNYKELRI